MIVYTATIKEWEKIKEEEYFESPSLEREGFIHCCYPKQALWVLNKHYKDEASTWLLCIDEEKLRSELIVEDLKNRGEAFPHVYGKINVSSIINKVKIYRDNNGEYSISKELKELLED